MLECFRMKGRWNLRSIGASKFVLIRKKDKLVLSMHSDTPRESTVKLRLNGECTETNWLFDRGRDWWFLYISSSDHPFKTLANFHNFWPLPPNHRHSSKMLMKGIFYPYVLWPFDHRHMGTPLPPKTCWRLKWMVPYVTFDVKYYTLSQIFYCKIQ